MAPPFDATQGFGYDKAAAEPCRHLQSDHRCAIHAELVPQGFPGCASFDCYGAGQHVTQQLFGGRSWRESPELATQMFSAYARQRALHEMQAMTQLALTRTEGGSAQLLNEVLARLVHLCEIDADIDAVALRRQVQQQIRSALNPAESN
ncbi:MAG TPA: hypothetical protein VN645_08610 [Steroidobacteraceae bacterium]|nr:hypothetical protein [Steroidobacteraceae bacterium]